jgi:hypothetical protein
MSISVLTSAVPRIVLDVLAERTSVGLDEIVVQVGIPEPALVSTCPLVPAAPAKVNAVVRLADAIVGAVSVLLVSVVVLAAVTTLLGVMIPDSATVAMIFPLYLMFELMDTDSSIQMLALV